MDTNRLLDYPSLTKHQIDSQEILLEYHSKIEAMIEMLMANDISDFLREKLHNYLWIISDLVLKAKELNKGLLDMLNEVMPSLMVSKTSMKG